MSKNIQENVFLRAAIMKSVHSLDAANVAERRWGAHSETARYLKAAVAPLTAGQDVAGTPAGTLTAGDITRRQFIQAVYSRQILGQLTGLTCVPAMTRINFEASPTSAVFSLEGSPIQIVGGDVGVAFADKRRIGIVTLVSEELLKLTDDSAETTIEGILLRAVSRGVDGTFVGSQQRGDITPAGLASVATQATGATLAEAFNAGVESFTGDLTQASVLVNPLTATTLRSPTETQITARGGMYGGLPAIASYGVPAGSLFVVDASRVIAAMNDVTVDVSDQASFYPVPQSAGDTAVSAYHTAQRGVRIVQYVDWQFLPGVAVQCQAAQS